MKNRCANTKRSKQGAPRRRRSVKPLKFLLSVMRDPKADKRTRIAVAIAALPYVSRPRTRVRPQENDE